MSADFTFDLLDPVTESPGEHEPAGNPRRDFLHRLVVGGGTLTVAGAMVAEFTPAASAASINTDLTILNAALILETLGRDFYAEALKHTRLSGQTARFVKVVHQHEVEHAIFVRKALGRYAKPLPRFDFGTRTHSQAQVEQTAYELEGTCTAALVGIAPLLTRKTLAAAGVLLPVEAQHISWISNIRGLSPAPSAFNPKDTIPGVEKIIAPLIVKAQPRQDRR